MPLPTPVSPTQPLPPQPAPVRHFRPPLEKSYLDKQLDAYRKPIMDEKREKARLKRIKQEKEARRRHLKQIEEARLKQIQQEQEGRRRQLKNIRDKKSKPRLSEHDSVVKKEEKMDDSETETDKEVASSLPLLRPQPVKKRKYYGSESDSDDDDDEKEKMSAYRSAGDLSDVSSDSYSPEYPHFHRRHHCDGMFLKCNNF